MDDQDFDRVAATFATFHAQFAPLFGRVESQRHSEQYLRGLLVKHDERRNAENLAEAIGGVTPRALQRLLTNAPWQHEPVIAALQAFLGPRLDAPDGVWVVDDTGFAKQGTKSVGVAARAAARTLGHGGRRLWPSAVLSRCLGQGWLVVCARSAGDDARVSHPGARRHSSLEGPRHQADPAAPVGWRTAGGHGADGGHGVGRR